METETIEALERALTGTGERSFLEQYEAKGKKQINKVKTRVEDDVDKAESNWQRLSDSVDEKVSEAIKKLGVPSRNEIQKLTKRVEELTKKVDELKPKKVTPKPRAHKTAASA